jgi:hypothetical protein
MKNKILILLMSVTVLLFQACKKDRTTVYVTTPSNPITPVVIPPSSFTTLKAFMNTLRPQIQAFSFDNSVGGTVRGDKGMTFTFAASSFRNASNVPVVGVVKINLIEVNRYTEMLGTGAFTEATNGLLSSAAMFNITATQNGQTVYLVKPFQASIPVNLDADLTNIKKFTGVINISANNDTIVKWASDTSFFFNIDSTSSVYDSLKKVYEDKRIIKFTIKTLGWCNLDAYINNATGNQVVASFTGINNILNAQVYMKIDNDGLKGLIPLYYDATKDEFNSSYYKLPPTWTIHLITLVKDKDKRVYIEDKKVVNAGVTTNFSKLKEISDADLETFFNSLN